MENKKPNNPIAFPRTAFDKNGQLTTQYPEYEGMTLRDYFANSAMQSMISKYGKPSEYHWQNNTKDGKPQLAKECYDIADAMLKQREL